MHRREPDRKSGRALLSRALEDERIEVRFPELRVSAGRLAEERCFSVLKGIKAALEDPGLDDEGCFQRTDNIMRAFEAAGVPIGYRHDFG